MSKLSRTKLSKHQNVKNFPLVEVFWTDACINPEHEIDLSSDEDQTFGGLVEMHDIGYLVRQNKRELVLCISRCLTDNTARHANTIPSNWVKSITYLIPAASGDREAPSEKAKDGPEAG